MKNLHDLLKYNDYIEFTYNSKTIYGWSVRAFINGFKTELYAGGCGYDKIHHLIERLKRDNINLEYVTDLKNGKLYKIIK